MNKFKIGILLTLLPFMAIAQKIHSQKQVYDKMVDAGIKHPAIVLKQAIVESANLKYKPAQRSNNYFGMLNNRGKLMQFINIEESINWYKTKIQSRYLGGDYFKFLSHIGYASDPRYKQKVNNAKLDFIIE